MVTDGLRVFDSDPAVRHWALAAHAVAVGIASDPTQRAANLRHGDTWFVGVDALPNLPDGSIGGVPLDGPWRAHVMAPASWHRAQLSIVYPGYPRQDAGESDANHRYRVVRHAAHVDGLLPEGPGRRRYLREPHAFILGLPLNLSNAAPLTVWPGSQQIIGGALRALIGGKHPSSIDLTDAYQAARRRCFDQITPQEIVMKPGQAVLLHRHLLHGVAPVTQGHSIPLEGRMIAYFRPQSDAHTWLNP